MTHSYVTWLNHTWHDRWQSCWQRQHKIVIITWRDSFIRDVTHSHVTWLIQMWHESSTRDMTGDILAEAAQSSYCYVTWLISMWHDSFICEMTHSYVTWVIHMWHDDWQIYWLRQRKQSLSRDTTHSYVTWLIHTWHYADMLAEAAQEVTVLGPTLVGKLTHAVAVWARDQYTYLSNEL